MTLPVDLSPKALYDNLSPDARLAYEEMRDRLNNNYFVKHEQTARPIRFRLEPFHEEALLRLFNGFKRQIVVKGRQVYFTTFSTVLMTDMCVSQADYSCTINNMTEADMHRTIHDKVHYVAKHSPAVADRMIDEKAAFTKDGMVFKNGSRILVTRSGRSHTSQFNLITEAAFTADTYPEKFMETYTGMINGSQFYINWMETSPYGAHNAFTELAKESSLREKAGLLRSIDFPVLFIPWWKKPRNVATKVDTERTPVSGAFEEYFKKVEGETGTTLTDRQRAWYVGKWEVESRGSWAQQAAEHPSTLAEALAHNAEVYIMQKEMNRAREEGRIRPIDYDPRLPTAVCWDFGGGVSHSAWICLQRDPDHPRMFRLVASHQSRDQPLAELLSELDRHNYHVSQHFLPHDARAKGQVAWKQTLARDTSIEEAFDELGRFNHIVIEKIANKKAGFDEAISFAGKVRFCDRKASSAIQSLEGVQREYDEKNDVIFDKLKKKGGAAEYNHLYDCFELAARAARNNMLLPSMELEYDRGQEEAGVQFDGVYV